MRVTDEARLNELIKMLPAYIAKYENETAFEVIIQGLCTDFDRKQNDQEEDPEPQTTGGDNCFPKSFKVNVKEDVSNMVIDAMSRESSQRPMEKNWQGSFNVTNKNRLARSYGKQLSVNIGSCENVRDLYNKTYNFSKTPNRVADESAGSRNRKKSLKYAFSPGVEFLKSRKLSGTSKDSKISKPVSLSKKSRKVS